MRRGGRRPGTGTVLATDRQLSYLRRLLHEAFASPSRGWDTLKRLNLDANHLERVSLKEASAAIDALKKALGKT